MVSRLPLLVGPVGGVVSSFTELGSGGGVGPEAGSCSSEDRRVESARQHR